MFGPAQPGVAKAVANSVAEGVIPVEEADDLFISVGVFIHWDASDDTKIQDYNYTPRRKPSPAPSRASRRPLKSSPSATTPSTPSPPTKADRKVYRSGEPVSAPLFLWRKRSFMTQRVGGRNFEV